MAATNDQAKKAMLNMCLCAGIIKVVVNGKDQVYDDAVSKSINVEAPFNVELVINTKAMNNVMPTWHKDVKVIFKCEKTKQIILRGASVGEYTKFNPHIENDDGSASLDGVSFGICCGGVEISIPMTIVPIVVDYSSFVNIALRAGIIKLVINGKDHMYNITEGLVQQQPIPVANPYSITIRFCKAALDQLRPDWRTNITMSLKYVKSANKYRASMDITSFVEDAEYLDFKANLCRLSVGEACISFFHDGKQTLVPILFMIDGLADQCLSVYHAQMEQTNNVIIRCLNHKVIKLMVNGKDYEYGNPPVPINAPYNVELHIDGKCLNWLEPNWRTKVIFAFKYGNVGDRFEATNTYSTMPKPDANGIVVLQCDEIKNRISSQQYEDFIAGGVAFTMEYDGKTTMIAMEVERPKAADATPISCCDVSTGHKHISDLVQRFNVIATGDCRVQRNYIKQQDLFKAIDVLPHVAWTIGLPNSNGFRNVTADGATMEELSSMYAMLPSDKFLRAHKACVTIKTAHMVFFRLTTEEMHALCAFANLHKQDAEPTAVCAYLTKMFASHGMSTVSAILRDKSAKDLWNEYKAFSICFADMCNGHEFGKLYKDTAGAMMELVKNAYPFPL